MRETPLALTWRPATANTAVHWIYEAALIAYGSALIALCAQMNIDLAFSPVPITGQTFAILVVGLLLGRARGLAAVAAYLLEGAAGLPVFAGASAGVIHYYGPTGGYLVGFLPAVYLIGYLAERRWDRNVFLTVLAMGMGVAVIHLFGLAWLSNFVPGAQLLTLGLLPFLVGDVVKIAAASVLLPALRKYVR